jgi:uncharacterized membrane protein YraQ (UPF0718 family)
MTEPNPYTPPVDEKRLAADDHRARGYANVALGLAVASFFFCGPLLGVVSIFFAWRALRLHPSSMIAKWAIGISIAVSLGWLAVWQFLDSQVPPPKPAPSALPSPANSQP